MGLNAYFAFTVAPKYGWRVALAAVFVEGLIFIALTLTKVRSAVVNAIPMSQKYAVGAGIGLFLTLIGLEKLGLVIGDKATLVTFSAGSLAHVQVWLGLLGLFLAAVLISRRIKGVLLISIVTGSALGWISGTAPKPTGIISTPTLSGTFIHLDLQGLISVGAIGVVFAFFMVDFFDTVGTVTGL